MTTVSLSSVSHQRLLVLDICLSSRLLGIGEANAYSYCCQDELLLFSTTLPIAGPAAAVAAGELGPEADSDEAIFLVSMLMAGTLSQVMANEPHVAWGEGRFSPLLPKLMSLLPLAYPPRSRVPRRKTGTSR